MGFACSCDGWGRGQRLGNALHQHPIIVCACVCVCVCVCAYSRVRPQVDVVLWHEAFSVVVLSCVPVRIILHVGYLGMSTNTNTSIYQFTQIPHVILVQYKYTHTHTTFGFTLQSRMGLTGEVSDSCSSLLCLVFSVPQHHFGLNWDRLLVLILFFGQALETEKRWDTDMSQFHIYLFYTFSSISLVTVCLFFV